MSKTDIKNYLNEEIKYIKDNYKIEVKLIKDAEKIEIKTIDDSIKSCMKDTSPEIQEDYLKMREQEISKIKREYEAKLAKEQRILTSRIKNQFVNAIAEALKEDIDPQFLYSQISKYEFSFEQLLDEAIEVRTKEMKEELKQVIREKIIDLLEQNPYLTLNESVAAFEDTANDEVEVAPLIAEAYDEVKANFAAKYKDLIKVATKTLSEVDVNKITEYINKQAHLKIILACSGKTQNELVSEVYKAVRQEQLSRLSQKLKQLNESKCKKEKIRNILGICATVALLLGLIFLLVFFIVTGIILGAVAFLFHKKLTKIKSEISSTEETIRTRKDE